MFYTNLPVMLRIAVLTLILLVATSCSRATPEDIRRLDNMEKQYGDRFSFALEPEIYITVQCKKGSIPAEDELIKIYRTFFWDEQHNEKRDDSSFVYMNVYDAKGRFQYQLFYEANKGKFGKNSADHY